ncbi:MAG TPA: PIG-L family deacetylase [Longimicrobiales bacterium]|nr:PIG-L family deacetylase [Longimicrobiales bacterium]
MSQADDDIDATIDLFPGPVLVLAPHMDDETLGCGRLLAALADSGVHVHILFATDGSRSPEVSPAHARALAATRAREARCAADALGVGEANASFLGLPDGRLRAHTADVTLGVARRWAGLRARTVLAPTRFDRHPDHLALRRAAVACAAHAPGDAALWEYFVYYRWRLLPGGDLRDRIRQELRVVPDTSAYADRKRRALACHVSQTTTYASGQRRPILPPERVEEVSRAPEVFVRYDARRPGAAILERDRVWVPLAHLLEPRLKAAKERLLGLLPPPAARSGGGPAAAPAPNAPTRVVVFASPFPLPAEWRFLARVDAHPDLELAGVLCRGTSTGRAARLRDLWRRRGPLAVPLGAAWLARSLRRAGLPPRDAVERVRERMRVVPDVHAPDVLRWVDGLDAHVGVVYGGPILKPALFTLPARGTLGVHHGRLPDYRGKKTIFWAIANGEPEAGVSIQAINAGLDTGRVVREGSVPIGSLSYAEVSRRAQALGVELLLDALLAGEPRPSGAASDEGSEPAAKEGTARSGSAPAGLARGARPGRAGRSTLYRDPGVRDLVRVGLRRLVRRVLRR